MNKLIISIIVPLTYILSSCTSTYFYSSLETTNENIQKMDNGDFLLENDSLWIAHYFKGENAPIQIVVYNKLDVPLYVDWQKSSLILNNISYSYNNGETVYEGTANTEGYSSADYYGGIYQSSTTNYKGTSNTPSAISFIPPKTMVARNTLKISPRFDNIDKKEFSKRGKITIDKNTKQHVDKAQYDYENSPLKFKSYLTLYTDSKNPQSYIAEFYTSSLLKTKANPKNLPNNMAERGDIFYQEKKPKNTGWDILLGTVIISGVVAFDVMTYNNNCRNCY